MEEYKDVSTAKSDLETYFFFFFFFFFSIITIYKLETKNKPKTYNSAPISMLCDVWGKLNVKNTKYNIKIYLS